jgi:hypothetical protein
MARPGHDRRECRGGTAREWQRGRQPDRGATSAEQVRSVAPPGLEPGRPLGRRILNPLRLPFRHEAKYVIFRRFLPAALERCRGCLLLGLLLGGRAPAWAPSREPSSPSPSCATDRAPDGAAFQVDVRPREPHPLARAWALAGERVGLTQTQREDRQTDRESARERGGPVTRCDGAWPMIAWQGRRA